MKLGLHVSPEMLRTIKADAHALKLSDSQVIRNKLAAIYGLPPGTPRKPAWVPDPLLAHDEIPKGADI